MALEPQLGNSTQAATVADEEISLLDYGRVVYKRRRLVLSLVGGAFLVSLIVSLLLPKYYAAMASVLPPQPEPVIGAPIALSGVGALGGGGAGGGSGAAAGLAQSFLGMKSPGDLWAGILKSQRVMDTIIDRFKLREVYGKETIEDTRRALEGCVNVDAGKEGIVSVTVEDKDPKQAAAMANAFIQEMDRVNRLTGTTSSGRTRAFIEQRLGETKAALAIAEDALRAFENRNKAVKLDDQATAIIQAFGDVKGKLVAKEVELGSLLSFATASHPQVKMAKTEIAELQGQLRKLEKGTPGARDIFVATDQVPNLNVEYLRLLRDVKYEEILFQLLTQQYEVARIQEAKDTPTVQILDYAKVPEKKSRPKRAIIVLLSTFVATFIGVFAAFSLEYLEVHRLKEAAAGKAE
jgi:uncharacterized protein involved in exopolysaccharide biosynthesis